MYTHVKRFLPSQCAHALRMQQPDGTFSQSLGEDMQIFGDYFCDLADGVVMSFEQLIDQSRDRYLIKDKQGDMPALDSNHGVGSYLP